MTSEVLDRPAMSSRERAGWLRHGAGLVGLAVSGALLLLLYRSIDVRRIGEALLGADRIWVGISVGMILPITWLRAVRFFWVAPAGALPGIREALRLTLVSSAINLFAPAKSGDLAKSYFVATRSETSAGVAIALVVYERLCDLFGLMSWCVFAWVVARPQVRGLPPQFWLLIGVVGAMCGVLISSERAARAWRAAMKDAVPYRKLRRLKDLAEGWPDLLETLAGRRLRVVLFSLLLWLVHLFQIWLFTVALEGPVPFLVCASLSAVALMAGQLPFTFAGLGARDVALVALLAPYMTAERAAAMGLLMSTRSLVPSLLGVPIMSPYVSSVVDHARGRQRAADAGQ